MVKKAFIKNILRDVLKYIKCFIILGSFLALFVGFNTSLKSTNYSSDKKKNTQEELNIMDIKLSSNVDFDDEDIKNIKENNNIKGVMGTKSTMVNYLLEEKNIDIKAISIPKSKDYNNSSYINRFIIKNGRFPNTINEGIIEEKTQKKLNIKIGQVLVLETNKEDDLRAKKIRIVGIVKNNAYEYCNQGTNYFIYLPINNFTSDNYNELYIKLENEKKYKTTKEELKKYVINSAEQKYNYNKEKLEENISSLKERLNELENTSTPIDSLNEYISTTTSELKEKEELLENLKNPTSSVIVRKNILKNVIDNNKNDIVRSNALLIITMIIISFIVIYNMFKNKIKEIKTLKKIGYNNFYILSKYILFVVITYILSLILGKLMLFRLANYLHNILIVSVNINITLASTIPFLFMLILILIIIYIIMFCNIKNMLNNCKKISTL